MKQLLLFLLIPLLLIACKNYTVNNKQELKGMLDKKITITGKALNAKLGAVLMMSDSTFIWIDEMQDWPDGYYQGDMNSKTLRVTGTLIERYDLPVFIHKKGEIIRSGMPVPEGTDLKAASHRYLLKKIRWKVISD